MTPAESAPTPERSKFGACLVVLPAALIASALAAIMLGQDTNWDLRNYHYYAGYAFLHKPANYDFAPAQLQSFFNPLVHVFTYMTLAHLPARTAAALFGAVQGINFFLIFLIGQTLFSGWERKRRLAISLAAAFTGFYGAGNLSELGTSFGDNLVSIPVLAGLFIILRYLLPDRTGRLPRIPLWFGGIILGAAAGLKLNSLIYVAAACLVLLPLLARKRFKEAGVFVAALSLGFLAIYGWWGMHLYLEYGNPLFPHLNTFFHSPYYSLETKFDDRFLPRGWMQTLFFPFLLARKNHLASELDLRDFRPAFLCLAVVLFAVSELTRKWRLAVPRESVSLRYLAAFLALSYILWQQRFSIYRYQVVLEMLIPVFLALVLAHFLRSERRAIFVSLIVFAFICAGVVRPDWGRQEFNDDFLRVRIPPVRDLDKSVILMAGGEGSSYIIPSFPRSTKFVRVFSNLSSPGENPLIDRKILEILAPYGPGRTLAYVTNPDEIVHTMEAAAFYGVTLDHSACFEVRSGKENRGYLCRALNGWAAGEPKPAAPPWNWPVFEDKPEIRLEAEPKEVIAGRDHVEFRLSGLKAQAVDLLYASNGIVMPPVRGYPLGAGQRFRVFIDSMTRKGPLHYQGIRASGGEHRNRWYRIDTLLEIR